jgi:thioredoxin reductase (NADPH)
LQRQASDCGTEFQRAEVTRIEAKDKLWSVATDDETHVAKVVIVATGSSLKHLGLANEEALMGRGVSHCASCDGPMYNGQTVGVVGGGDSALQEALTLANYAERVLVFNQAESFSGQETYRKRVAENGKITVQHQTVVEEIFGGEVVTGVRIRDLKASQSSQAELSGLFVYVGLEPNTSLLRGMIKLTESGHVPTDNWMKTERDGLYAVGDIRQDSARQAITGAGDGATAAIAVGNYVRNNFSR